MSVQRLGALACTFFVMGLAGHGLSEALHDAHTEHGVLTGCLVLFVMFASAVAYRRPVRIPFVVVAFAATRPNRFSVVATIGRARGSPALLQRFLT